MFSEPLVACCWGIVGSEWGGLGNVVCWKANRINQMPTGISFGNLHAALCGHKGGNTRAHTRKFSLAYLTLHLSGNERKTCWQLPEYTWCFMGALFAVMTQDIMEKRAVMRKYIVCERNVSQRKFFSQPNSNFGRFFYLWLFCPKGLS